VGGGSETGTESETGTQLVLRHGNYFG
jgi:hypothetical protein